MLIQLMLKKQLYAVALQGPIRILMPTDFVIFRKYDDKDTIVFVIPRIWCL